jgi:hypothetical protein
MRLYHFSNYDFNTLKPSFFGLNHYSKNEMKASSIPRSFCYDTSTPQEHLLTSSKFRYTLEIDKNTIYDLDHDKLNFLSTFKNDITFILGYLRKKYLGVSYTTSFKCYCLFKDIKPIKQEAL